MPDFDIDFEDTQRQRVIDYCAEKIRARKGLFYWNVYENGN